MSQKWTYVAKGHYSTPDNSGGTVHVLSDGTVYKTHPKRATRDITGSEADKYIASATGKTVATGKKKAATNGKKPKPGKKNGKKKVKAFAKAAGRTARAFAAPTVALGRAVARGGAAVVAETQTPRRAMTVEEAVFGIAPPKKKPAKKKAKKHKKAKKPVREAVIVDGKVYYSDTPAKKKRKPKKTTPPAPMPQTIEQYLGF